MFSCTLCRASFKCIKGYNKHQKHHAYDANLQIPCLYTGYEIKCDSYGSFKQHFYVFTQLNCNFKCQSMETLKRYLYHFHFGKWRRYWMSYVLCSHFKNFRKNIKKQEY